MSERRQSAIGQNPTEHFRDFSESILPQQDLSERFCRRPFEHFEIMHGHGPEQSQGFGDVYVCCAGWLSRKVGNYLQQDLANIWNSGAAREIRSSIIDGSFRYCNQQACPFIQDGRLERREDLTGRYREIVDGCKTYLEDLPVSYLLCYDRSCNLACPSCRGSRILFSEGEGVGLPRRLNEKLMRDLFAEPHERLIHLQVTGSGDPFASLPFRELLSSLNGRGFPNLRVDLFTNGVMLNPKNWKKLHGIHGHIQKVSVSVDAASKATYSVVRGGDWSVLMDNLDFIGQLQFDGEIADYHTNFVVQAANFSEIGDFVRLSRKKGARTINFSFVSDWGTWSQKEFEAQAIWRPSHPRFPALLDALTDPDLLDPIVALGALASYRALGLRAGRGDRTAGLMAALQSSQ